MTEADVIQPSASIASTGLGIRYIGQHCYAYSGFINYTDPASGNQTMLDFNSGSGVIVAEFTFSYNARVMGGADLGWQISLNDILVWTAVIESQTPSYMDVNIVPLVLPPDTKVLVELRNPASSVFAGQSNCTMTGRVYGAE